MFDKGLLQLGFDDLLKDTPCSNNTVEISTEWTVDEVTILLFDRPLPEIVSHLDKALGVPGFSCFFKTRMEEGKQESSRGLESSHTIQERWQIIRDIHKDHIGNDIIELIWGAGPG
jgi:hypothetical protein